MAEQPKAANFNEILKTSKIAGLPQIAKSRGKLRVYKISLFVLCIFGFLYQSLEFTLIYFNYPVSLNIELEYPEGILLPAVTMCSGYKYDKARYCRFNPDHCEPKDDDFDTQKIKEEYAFADKKPKREDFRKYGYHWRDLHFITVKLWDYQPVTRVEDVIKVVVLNEWGERLECFVFNHQIFHHNPNASQIPTKSRSIFTFVKDIASIYMLDDIRMRFREAQKKLQISVHSPYVLSNPYMEGRTLGRGTIDVQQVGLTQTELLPHPYRTDCRDYIKEWKENNGGPLSKQMCIKECIYRRTMQHCKCYPLGLVYPSKERFCEEADSTCTDTIKVDDCYTSCKPDCRSFEYDYVSTKRSIEYKFDVFLRLLTIHQVTKEIGNATTPDDVTGITMNLLRKEKVIYRYVPKYELIEFLGYLGGYMGVWLGVSLLSVSDLFETAFVAFLEKRKGNVANLVYPKEL